LLARFGISTHDDDAMTSFPWLPEYSHRKRGPSGERKRQQQMMAKGGCWGKKLYIDNASHA